MQKVVTDLALNHKLVLSTDERSAADTFTVGVTIRPPTASGDRETAVWTARRKARVCQYVICDELVFGYYADGLLVEVDHANPGGLTFHQGGHCTLRYRQAQGRVDFGWGYDPAGGRSSVAIDPAPVLLAALGDLAEAGYDPAGRTLTGRSARGSVLELSLARPGRAVYPLDHVAMVAPEGVGLSVGRVQLDPPEARWESVTPDDVRRLYLPVRVLTDEEARRGRRYPYKDFAADERERAAAGKLRELLGFRPARPVVRK